MCWYSLMLLTYSSFIKYNHEAKIIVIEVMIISGGNVGRICAIPRMLFTPPDTKMPFKLNRRQVALSLPKLDSHTNNYMSLCQEQERIEAQKKSEKERGQAQSGNRFLKSAGLLQDSKRAIEGTYIDKKCPFTGDVSIRGRILAGYEKRHSNIPAHISPCFRVKEGDHVTVGQCRWATDYRRRDEVSNFLKDTSRSSGGGKKEPLPAI
ncbi:40S ribosomal protein S11 [Tanacetum coccineum]